MKLSPLVLLTCFMLLSKPTFAVNIPYSSYSSTMVDETCELNTVDLHFGVLDFINKSGNFQVSGYANIKCTQGTNYKLTIETVSKISNTRYLISSTTNDQIAYNFYKKGTNELLGDSGVNDYIEGVGSGIYERVDFDAKINSNQNITPGFYRDTVTISVNY